MANIIADNSESTRRLRVFLCHSSSDKAAVRNLYRRLRADGLAPWLDEENLLPGQNWQQEIRKAVRASDVVIVCLSRGATTKAGYVQKEIRFALDVADERPDGTIFVIPLKLEECDVPERLKHLHWVNLFNDQGYERLMSALRACAEQVEGIALPIPNVRQVKSPLTHSSDKDSNPALIMDEQPDLESSLSVIEQKDKPSPKYPLADILVHEIPAQQGIEHFDKVHMENELEKMSKVTETEGAKLGERVYANWITGKDLQLLLASPPAAFNWMILEAVDEVKPPGVYRSDIDLTRFEAGRAFGATCELRWQRDGQHFHTLLVGDVALPSSPLAEHHQELGAANFEQTEREYYLWGEWSETLPEWVEATIPHIFDYPPPPSAGRWRRKIITVEYVNRATGEMEFYRFAGVREESL